MTHQHTPYHYADPKNMMQLQSIKFDSVELELAAALQSNGNMLDSMNIPQLKSICEQTNIIIEYLTLTNETRFTLYDMIDALVQEPEPLRPENFKDQGLWYKSVLQKAIELRKRYEK